LSSPGPRTTGHEHRARPHAAGDIVILAALPDPAGVDRGHETVTLINTTSSGIDLTGWHLADAANGATIDTVTYTASHVHPGRTICFGCT